MQPARQQAGLLVADLADGLVAGAQAAELGQVAGRTGERPAGAGQGEEFPGLGADEAVDAEAAIEGITTAAAARADAVAALQADVARGRQEVAAGGVLG
jgi:hypothetical protein